MKNITRLILVLIVTSFLGCSADSDSSESINFALQLVPIAKVDIAQTFTRGETAKIKVFYARLTSCHSFSGFELDNSGNERTVAVVNVIVEEQNCEMFTQNDLIEESLDFLVGDEELYRFKFWQGENALGEAQYLIVDVPVI